MSLLLSQSGVFILGLCLGSFLNVVIYRLPKTDMSVSSPRRSLCPSCQAPISWYDNLPVISYVFLRGKCRACGHNISIRYPLVELTTGLLTLAVFLKSGFSIQALAELFLVLALIAATFIDLDEMIIPDVITFPGMIIGLAAAAISPNPALIGPWMGGTLMESGLTSLRWLSIIGSASGLLLGWFLIWGIIAGYARLTGKEGMGGGDMTLLGMIGAFLGWRAIFPIIFMSSIIGLIAYVLTAMVRKSFDLKEAIPFGPFLAMAALIFLFFGESILRWYWG